MCARHPAPDEDNHCTWCGQYWPCPPRRLAERAAQAAHRNRREAWTARHDLSNAGWRTDLGSRTAVNSPGLGAAAELAGRGERSGTNRGLFD